MQRATPGTPAAAPGSGRGVRPARRRALVTFGAAGVTLLLRAPAGAAPPLAASLTAKKVAGNKVRSTVRATVALPGLNWSGTLGTWDVPEGGQRQVSVQPPGMPVPFQVRLQHAPSSLFMSMLLYMKLMQQEVQASASAKIE
ncbi:MAG: hypothetical protein KIS83_03620 [Rubrivivax sp.]|nr:hypothetical protein [Rubrivivax sp.]